MTLFPAGDSVPVPTRGIGTRLNIPSFQEFDLALRYKKDIGAGLGYYASGELVSVDISPKV